MKSFSKSILRAVAIDGGAGLENPTRIINLLDEFSDKTQRIQVIKYASSGMIGAVILGVLSGGSVGLLGASMVLVAGALGAAMKHGMSTEDARELALLHKHRSLLHALAEIDQTYGTEKTLTRYEELITSYSQFEDCFYFGQSRISAAEVTGVMEQAIASNATTIQGAIPAAAQPIATSTQSRFSLAEIAKSETQAATPSLPPATPFKWDEDTLVVDEPVSPFTWDEDTNDSLKWMDDLLHYPAVLIYGAQGSGKTTLATWLINERTKRGHDSEILDPHRKFGQWDGLKIYGDGMDYAEIDKRLISFAKLVKSRYKQRSQQPSFNPKPITVAAEEFTNWAKRCTYSAEFFESALSDIRKINMHVLFISHARTLKGLGGSKGFADTRDKTLLEIELLAQVDPSTGEAVPTGRGLIKYPGREAFEIAIPNLISNSFSPSSDSQGSGSVQAVRTAEPPELRELNQSELTPNLPRTDLEPTSELNLNLAGIDPKSEEITLQERGLVIEETRKGETRINEILFKVWGVKQGGSKAYAIARKKLDQILADAGISLN